MNKNIIIYTMNNCPYCVKAKKLLLSRGVFFKEILLNENDDDQWDALFLRSKMKTVPQIFKDDDCLGGFSDLEMLDKKDNLKSLL